MYKSPRAPPAANTSTSDPFLHSTIPYPIPFPLPFPFPFPFPVLFSSGNCLSASAADKADRHVNEAYSPSLSLTSPHLTSPLLSTPLHTSPAVLQLLDRNREDASPSLLPFAPPLPQPLRLAIIGHRQLRRGSDLDLFLRHSPLQRLVTSDCVPSHYSRDRTNPGSQYLLKPPRGEVVAVQ